MNFHGITRLHVLFGFHVIPQSCVKNTWTCELHVIFTHFTWYLHDITCLHVSLCAMSWQNMLTYTLICPSPHVTTHGSHEVTCENTYTREMYVRYVLDSLHIFHMKSCTYLNSYVQYRGITYVHAVSRDRILFT